MNVKAKVEAAKVTVSFLLHFAILLFQSYGIQINVNLYQIKVAQQNNQHRNMYFRQEEDPAGCNRDNHWR